MSEADKMFKDLDYEMIENDKEMIEYLNCNKHSFICFYRKTKSFEGHTCELEAVKFSIQELQAINKKCEELGWKGEVRCQK